MFRILFGIIQTLISSENLLENFENVSLFLLIDLHLPNLQTSLVFGGDAVVVGVV